MFGDQLNIQTLGYRQHKIGSEKMRDIYVPDAPVLSGLVSFLEGRLKTERFPLFLT
jgi:hypothetical protein